MNEAFSVSRYPGFARAIDWNALCREYAVPDLFVKTVFTWPRDRLRELQNRRFVATMAAAWQNPFYRKRWRGAGVEPGDIRSLDDLSKLPMYSSDDISKDQAAYPPYGEFNDITKAGFATTPYKMFTSGGTTGKARVLMVGPTDYAIMGLNSARVDYLLGARPGDVFQITTTCALGRMGWNEHDNCREWLGILPITTGSGAVTPSRRQLEIAFEFGTNLWNSFPEYMVHLAKVCREELGRDVRELKTKFIKSFLGPDLDGRVRRELEELWGCPVYDSYGTHEFGLGAFECKAQDGLHWMEDFNIFEIVDPETGKPAAKGETGTLVVTSLIQKEPPIIRYNLQDLARLKHDSQCVCGGTFLRIDHFLGRADTMVKIRGTNVYPMACQPVVKSDPRTNDSWICVVEQVDDGGVRRDVMTLHVEVRADARTRDGLKEKLEQHLRAQLNVSVPVVLAEEGSLAKLVNLAGDGREGKARRLIDRRPGATRNLPPKE